MVVVAIPFYKKLGVHWTLTPGRSERPLGAGAVPHLHSRGENQEQEQVCFCLDGIWPDLSCISESAFKKDVCIHLGGVVFDGNSGLRSIVHRPEVLEMKFRKVLHLFPNLL